MILQHAVVLADIIMLEKEEEEEDEEERRCMYPYPPRAREALPSKVRAGGTHPSGGERGEARGQGSIKDSDEPLGLVLLMITVHTRVDRKNAACWAAL